MTVRAALRAVAVLGPLLAGCAGARTRAPAAPPRVVALAVLPLDNASGASAPLGPLREELENALRARGVEVVTGEPVDRWLAAHRLRFTGAIPPDAAAAAPAELGVDALLVTALEQHAGTGIPRVAVGMRVVSAEAMPRILWSDAVALAGDDAPGLFGTGLVRSLPALRARALARVTGALAAWLRTGRREPPCRPEGRFAPTIAYRSELLDGEPRSVAILPFVNETPRRRAGDVVAEAFARGLAATGRFEIVEPGLVRESLLARRIVMEGGVSLDTARVVLGALDADLVMAGYVRELADDSAGGTPPRVEFTALLIDRRSEEIVWEVSSSHHGDDGVWAFELGTVRSVNALACRMVASAAAIAARGPSTPTRAAAEGRAPRRAWPNTFDADGGER